MMRVCRLRKPRVGTWSSSEPDSLLLNLGLPPRPRSDATAAVAPAIVVTAPDGSLGCNSFIADSVTSGSRGLEGKDSVPTYIQYRQLSIVTRVPDLFMGIFLQRLLLYDDHGAFVCIGGGRPFTCE